MNPYEAKHKRLYMEEELERISRRLKDFAKEIGENATIEINGSAKYTPTVRIFIKWGEKSDELSLYTAQVAEEGALIGAVDNALSVAKNDQEKTQSDT